MAIDTSKLETTLHKGQSITSDGKEADLFIYKNHGDGTGILTDGINFYFAYNDLLSIGDQCPPEARFMTPVEEIVIRESRTKITACEDFVKTKPEATEEEIYALFKAETAKI